MKDSFNKYLTRIEQSNRQLINYKHEMNEIQATSRNNDACFFVRPGNSEISNNETNNFRNSRITWH